MPTKAPTFRIPRNCKRLPIRDDRESAGARGYGARWRKLRKMVLAAQPLCVRCDRPAKHVDHIVPRSQGGDDSMANLQALCATCHNRKTAREDGGFGNRKASV